MNRPLEPIATWPEFQRPLAWILALWHERLRVPCEGAENVIGIIHLDVRTNIEAHHLVESESVRRRLNLCHVDLNEGVHN